MRCLFMLPPPPFLSARAMSARTASHVGAAEVQRSLVASTAGRIIVQLPQAQQKSSASGGIPPPVAWSPPWLEALEVDFVRQCRARAAAAAHFTAATDKSDSDIIASDGAASSHSGSEAAAAAAAAALLAEHVLNLRAQAAELAASVARDAGRRRGKAATSAAPSGLTDAAAAAAALVSSVGGRGKDSFRGGGKDGARRGSWEAESTQGESRGKGSDGRDSATKSREQQQRAGKCSSLRMYD